MRTKLSIAIATAVFLLVSACNLYNTPPASSTPTSTVEILPSATQEPSATVTPAPTSTHTIPPLASCASKYLGIEVTMPNQEWVCNVEPFYSPIDGSFYDETINVESPVFKGVISSGARDIYCGRSPDNDSISTCEDIYKNPHLTVFILRYDGVISEIFGFTDQQIYLDGEPWAWIWLSFGYKQAEIRDISEAEKAELYQLLDSIIFSQPGK